MHRTAVSFLLLSSFMYSLIHNSVQLKCYTSALIPYGPAGENASISLDECEDENGCCQELGTLSGWRYGCLPSSQCPGADEDNCGKHVDGSWCYCKDEQDERCMPALIRKERIGAAATTNRESHPLQCYSGLQTWTLTQEGDPVSLANCTTAEFCCYRVRSLDGILFRCATDCPTDWSTRCSSNDTVPSDSGWCFCKDSNDEKCAPRVSNKGTAH